MAENSDLQREIEQGEQGGRVQRAVLRIKTLSSRHPALRLLHKVLVAVVGGFLVALGLIMLVTPGPGWLFIFLGIGVWSTEFEWAHRLNQKVKRAVLRIWRWWSGLLAEWRFRRARDRPWILEQGPRHMRAEAPDGEK